MTSSSSVPRQRRRRSSSCISGGSTKMVVAPGYIFLMLPAPFDLDDEDNRDAQLHVALDFAAQRAVVVLAVVCVLDDLVMCQMILKIGYRHEVVVYAVLFPSRMVRVVAETVC